MGYVESTFQGDDEFPINCTGDCVVGDEVRFERARFGGSYKKPTFLGFELITGKIEKDSYGATAQQHTFTLRLGDGELLLIKGRNLYRQSVFRKPWCDEAARQARLEEKHARGSQARALREQRLAERDSSNW